MAFVKMSIVGGVAITLAVCLALCGPARAVSLNSLVAKKKEPVAFAQISLATATATQAELNAALQSATQAELTAAMQSAIQAAVAEELGQMIEQEIKDSNLFDNVKGLATGALGDMMGSLKASMGETCQRFAALAEKKLNFVDEKLQRIAGGDESSGEASSADDQSDGSGSSFAEKNAPVSRAEAAPHAAALQPTPESSADRLAFLEVALREKHKGFFGKIKGFFRKGLSKIKKVGSYVKKGVKSLWNVVKPAVANGVRSAVSGLKKQVPALIGKACDDAEDKLEHLESKMLPETEDADAEEVAA